MKKVICLIKNIVFVSLFSLSHAGFSDDSSSVLEIGKNEDVVYVFVNDIGKCYINTSGESRECNEEDLSAIQDLGSEQSILALERIAESKPGLLDNEEMQYNEKFNNLVNYIADSKVLNLLCGDLEGKNSRNECKFYAVALPSGMVVGVVLTATLLPYIAPVGVTLVALSGFGSVLAILLRGAYSLEKWYCGGKLCDPDETKIGAMKHILRSAVGVK